MGIAGDIFLLSLPIPLSPHLSLLLILVSKVYPASNLIDITSLVNYAFLGQATTKKGLYQIEIRGQRRTWMLVTSCSALIY